MSRRSDDRDANQPPTSAAVPASIDQPIVKPGSRCEMDDADEPLGGDPPCWAHLFEDDLTTSDR